MGEMTHLHTGYLVHHTSTDQADLKLSFHQEQEQVHIISCSAAWTENQNNFKVKKQFK